MIPAVHDFYCCYFTTDLEIMQLRIFSVIALQISKIDLLFSVIYIDRHRLIRLPRSKVAGIAGLFTKSVI